MDNRRAWLLMSAAMAFFQTTISEDDRACDLKKCKALSYDYGPVCGSNSKTYVNQLELECYQKECYSNLRLVKMARCGGTCIPRKCNAKKVWSPVCGSDGVLYGNEEHLSCYQSECCPGLRVVQKKKCSCEFNEKCLIPAINSPVCGSNGRTYGNEWELRCYQQDCYPDLHVVRNGACERDKKDKVLKHLKILVKDFVQLVHYLSSKEDAMLF